MSKKNLKRKRLLSILTTISVVMMCFAGGVSVLAEDSLAAISKDTVTAAKSTGVESTVETTQTDDVITVNITSTDLASHANANGAQGYWTGFAVTAPNGAEKAKYAFDTEENISWENAETLDTLETDVAGENEGIAFYTNAGEADPKTKAMLQWLDNEGNPVSAVTTFIINIDNVTLDIEDYTPVVVEAKIGDYHTEEEVYIDYTVDSETTPGVVAISMTDLSEHKNANNEEGYWTGFAVEAPADATQFKYAFGTAADAMWERGLAETEDIDGNGKQGVAFITDANAAQPKKYVKLQWFDVENNAITDVVEFEMNLENVKFNWILSETVELALSTGTAEVTLDKTQTDGVITVAYTAQALDKHENGEGSEGYWVGFAVEAPVDTAKANVTFGEDSYTGLSLEDITETKKGITFYTNAGAAQPKTEAILQWVDAEGNSISAPTEFVIDISGVTLAGLPYISADDVAEAKIVDNANIEVKPYKTYSVTAAANESGVIVVDIDMKDLKSHKNGADEMGYWTGFAVTAPDNAATLRYAFASDIESLSMSGAAVETGVATVDEIEKNGAAFYTNTGSTPKKYVRLQWFDVNGEAITNVTEFEMDLSGVAHYSETVRSSGGGRSSNYYTVKFETNGGSKITSVKAKKEAAISAPAAPVKDGYVFDGWYTDKELTQKYDFASIVTKSFTLYAKWTEAESNAISFVDVKKDAWYYDVVCEAVELGLMNGISETEFAPELNVSRGMFVTILYRAADAPTVNAQVSFVDVDARKYYAPAVAWANENGIVNGVTDTLFAPDANITREQMAAMLYRFAKTVDTDTALSDEITYTDSDMISAYAAEAVVWANAAKIMEGNADGSFAPLRNASRAEAAAVFVRLMSLIK